MADQVAEALDVVRAALGDRVQAIYLYGSAVMGGLRPNSDLDLLVVVSEPTTSSDRRQLVERLTPISLRSQRPMSWRPLELTIVFASEVKPWRFPPRTEFAPKDEAADWALTQLRPDASKSLQRARDVYLGTAQDAWQGLESEAETIAGWMVDRIENPAGRA